MSFRIWFSVFAICALLVIFSDHGVAQTLKEIIFQESLEDFPNPERGFYRARELPRPEQFDLRGESTTLIYGRISADSFRYEPFPAEYLQAIQNGFDEARKNGIKVNPRVAYNHGPHPGARARYGDDAPKETIMTHISQLKPLWERNKDVINVIDAGFIGGWGEWHNSAHGLDNPQDRKDILFVILDALPKDRMVVQRYPRFKREIFGGSETSTDSILTRERAFDGSKLARVGHLNDCFLSSPTDVGSYQNLDKGWPVERELDYIGAESPYVPYGGETCRPHERGRCANAVKEMEKLHINYLNLDYNKQVITRWQEEGCFEEIKRRIGYRFVLTTARIPENLKPGGVLEIEFSIKNVGFGELFNPRSVEIVLRNNNAKSEEVADLAEEPRFWGAGHTSTVHTFLSIPNSIPEGQYILGIRMPDPAPTLYHDPRYAIRLENENIWDAYTGINAITSDLRISKSAPGAENTNFTKFEEIKLHDEMR
jgi:hypothetical protein